MSYKVLYIDKMGNTILSDEVYESRNAFNDELAYTILGYIKIQGFVSFLERADTGISQDEICSYAQSGDEEDRKSVIFINDGTLMEGILSHTLPGKSGEVGSVVVEYQNEYGQCKRDIPPGDIFNIPKSICSTK